MLCQHLLFRTQWGDEGKGKMTDYLAEEAEVIVRYQGGNNGAYCRSWRWPINFIRNITWWKLVNEG